MELLQKTWVRLILSLFAGGIVTELIFISTGDPTRPRAEGAGSISTLITGVIIFMLLTYILKRMGHIK